MKACVRAGGSYPHRRQFTSEWATNDSKRDGGPGGWNNRGSKGKVTRGVLAQGAGR